MLLKSNGNTEIVMDLLDVMETIIVTVGLYW